MPGYTPGRRPPDPVRYQLRDLPAVLATPLGRRQLALGQLHAAFPITAGLARVYRRTLIAGTRIVSVIGSEGKSTTVRAVSVALGLPLRESLEINEKAVLPFQLLRIPPGRRHAVIETAIDSRGQMAVFARMIRPQLCVATTIGTEHSGSLGAKEVICDEKSQLVRALPPWGLAVLNGDDPSIVSMASLTRARVVTYGLGADNQVRATDVVTEWPLHTSFTLHCDGAAVRLRCHGIDVGVVYSALAAVAVAGAEGVPIDLAAKRLAELPPARARLTVEQLPSGATLLDDSHHASATATLRSLEVLESFPGERKLVVLGDLQEVRENLRETYRQIGARAGRIASRLYLVTGSGENAKCYRVGAKRAGLEPSRITVATRDVATVIAQLRDELRPGDVVLVKGRYYQRLERVRLALFGRQVQCTLPYCRVPTLECSACTMLERGWSGRRAFF